MPDYLKEAIPQFYSDLEKNRQVRRQQMDRITKMLDSNTPTPVEAASMMQMTQQPVTKFDIMRGVRRPSMVEAQAAARAAQSKYEVDMSKVAEMGMRGAANDMQVLLNAINSQADAGNEDAATHKDIINSMTADMAPSSALLATQEYFSEIGKRTGKVSEQDAHQIATDVMRRINPKAKLQFRPESSTKQNSYKSYVFTQTQQVKDADGNVQEIQIPYEIPFTPEGRALPAQPMTAVGGDQLLKANKTTQAKAPTVKEVTDVQGLDMAKNNLQEVKDWLIEDDGSVDRTKVVTLANSVPMTEGREMSNKIDNAIFSYIFLKSGQTVTEQERAAWLKIFKPSSLDSEEQIKAKLENLDKFFAGSVEMLPSRLKKTLTNSTEQKQEASSLSAPSSNEEAVYQSAREALKRGATRSLVEKRLKESGFDPSKL